MKTSTKVIIAIIVLGVIGALSDKTSDSAPTASTAPAADVAPEAGSQVPVSAEPAAPEEPSVPKATVASVVADNSLMGQTVQVSGYAVISGELNFLYQEMGSMTSVGLNISALPTETKTQLLTECGSGCGISVEGRIGTGQFGTKEIRVTAVR